MWKLNDTVVYGSVGICEISDIRDEEFLGEKRKYYILRPLFDEKNTVFVPSFNEALMAKMFPVLRRDELLEVIKKIPEIESSWIDNDKERQETYKTVLESGDRRGIVSVIKALFERNETLEKSGKKLRLSDENFKRQAENIFENECAHVFGIPRHEVPSFITSELSCEK